MPATATKVCANPACALAGQPQPWENFYAQVKRTDGSMRQPRARCKRCELNRQRPRDRHRRQCARNGIRLPDLGPKIPLEPFARWLWSLDLSSRKLARLTGIEERRVRIYLDRECQTVREGVVDRALCRANGPHIAEIYPDYWDRAERAA